MSWNDAKEYVAWLSKLTGKPYRLPSEAEWEYAARAGTQTAYSWGDEIGKGNANCWVCGSDWDRKLAPVGSFAPNAFGLYDMHGNVWEWVEDCNNNNYDGAPTDGSAWTVDIMGPQGGSCVFRVNRGGAFNNDFRGLRSASRSFNSPETSWNTLGFRVARTLSARASWSRRASTIRHPGPSVASQQSARGSPPAGMSGYPATTGVSIDV